jgi:hypothetical protein
MPPIILASSSTRPDDLDLGLVRTRSNELGRGAIAKHERKRIEEHRLAGSGLAGHDVESRGHSRCQPLDQDAVSYGQLNEHCPVAALRCAFRGRNRGS